MRTIVRWLFCATLLCCLSAVCLSDRAAAQTNYPTSNGRVMRLSFAYQGNNVPWYQPEETEPEYEIPGPEQGYWRLKPGNGIPTSGGWMRVTGFDYGPPARAEIPDNTSTVFPIEIEYGNQFAQLRQAIRDKIHVEAKLVLRPHYDSTGSLSHTVTSSTTLGSSSFTLSPSAPFQWLDQDVVLQVEVWCEGDIVDITPDERFVFQLPTRMRAVKSFFNLLSPYMTPVAIIGRPPGDQSWSRLTLTSGGGAGLATWQGTSNSVTTEESYGFGPFQHQEPTHTERRGTNRGINQNLSFNFTLGYGTNNPWGPGEGDVMFCLLRPTFAVYKGVRDMDLRYLSPASPCQGAPKPEQGAPTPCQPTASPSPSPSPSQSAPAHVVFPMRELLNPSPGGPVANLTASENAAFRALNPLLSDPHAILSEPRYYHVLDLALHTGAQASGGAQTQTITRQQVETIMANSSTYADTTSVTIPLGAIAQAAGLSLPIPDFQYRYTETTTASTEYRSMHTLEGSSGSLVEFQIADSNPNRWLYVGIYYDTYFRTFAFRDAATPIRAGFAERVIEDYGVMKLPQHAWKAFRYEDSKDEAPEFLVIGSLKDFGVEEGLAELVPMDKGKPRHRVSVLPETGNVMISDLPPGDYQITSGKTAHLLSVSKEGEVTFE